MICADCGKEYTLPPNTGIIRATWLKERCLDCIIAIYQDPDRLEEMRRKYGTP